MTADPESFFKTHVADRLLSPAERRRLFELLYGAYADSIYLSAFSRLRNRDDALDVCQDTFLHAMRWAEKKGRKWPEKPNFPAWLHHIARNLVNQQFRRPRRPVQPLNAGDPDTPGFDVPGPVDETPGSELERQEWTQARIKALDDCIKSLSERRRAILSLVDVEKRTYEEVARRYGMTSGGVGALLYRIRGTLRDCME